MTRAATIPALLLSSTVAVLAGGGGQPSRTSQPVQGFEQLQQWAEAVGQHVPGRLDHHVSTIGSWSGDEVRAFLVDLTAVFRFFGSSRRRAFDHEGRVVTQPDVGQLLGLTEGETEERDLTRLVKRAALLHSDIVVFGAGANTPAWPWTVLPPRQPSKQRRNETMRASDGRSEGSGGRTMHWDFVRFLLDAVRPSAAGDEMVAKWYRAVAAWMLDSGALADAEIHLDDALALLPDDPEIKFYSGALYEAYSAPAIQAVAESDKSVRSAIGSLESQLRRAAAFYAAALEIDPSHGEARMRLGRVAGRMGQHEKAAVELRRVVGETRDEVLLYIACLVLAAEEQALGRPGAARDLYERAAALFPSAPSPRLALGHLMREAGDREAAVLSVMDAIRPRVIDDYADPWWSYDLLPGRRCWTLLEEVRLMAPQAESR